MLLAWGDADWGRLQLLPCPAEMLCWMYTPFLGQGTSNGPATGNAGEGTGPNNRTDSSGWQAKRLDKRVKLLQDAGYAGAVRGLDLESLADDLTQHSRPAGGHLEVAIQDLQLGLHAKGQLAETKVVQQAP